MKVPINWLKEYVHIPESIEQLTDKLTAIGHMQDHQPQAIGDDIVLDLEVRQNRSDCLSIVGIAREVSASLHTPLILPKIDTSILDSNTPMGSTITINDSTICYRFNTLKMDNIKIDASPQWLIDRIEAYGMKSINNVVDITNFVMIEFGEPLHAFDADLIGSHIIIRQAKDEEILKVLGNKSVALKPSDIVIADESEVLAMAGIIGGVQSAVSNTTSTILLEAATYNQSYIRRSSLAHSIRTEASLRHEKFLHPELTVIALQRAAQLIKELCGGRVIAHDDAFVSPVEQRSIRLSLSRMGKLAGLKISMDESVQILEGLGIKTIKESDDVIVTNIPYTRTDIVLEEDVIEEVLRIYGYDKIASTLPLSALPKEITSESFLFEEEIRDILTGYGFDEIITEPLVHESYSHRAPVLLQNSLNAEKTMLRTTLKNGLNYALNYQKKAKRKDILLFEIGKIYSLEADLYVEEKMVTILLSSQSQTFSSVKGIAEALCLRLLRTYDTNIISITRGDSEEWYIEIKTESLFKQTPLNSAVVQTSLRQILYEDISVTVPNSTRIGELLSELRKTSKLIYRVRLGENPRDIGNNRKSVFLRFEFTQSGTQISANDIKPIKEQIIRCIEEKFDGTLRK